MKKAYLFGAAALLILLIVVAYIASNRQKEEAACPPQVVGSMAEPVVRILNFDDADDEVLPLNRSEPAVRRADPEIRIPTLTYVTRPQKYKESLVVGPPEYIFQKKNEYEAQVENYPDIPMGGPQPLSPFLNQSCSNVYTPKTPYTPKPRPDFGEITPTSTDRLEKLLEAQRDRSSEWATRLRDMERELIEMIERQGSGPYESPDSTLSPIDEERLVEY